MLLGARNRASIPFSSYEATEHDVDDVLKPESRNNRSESWSEMGKLGIIGGSGIYALDQLEEVSTFTVVTPFGEPSGPILEGRLGKTDILFLPRHGDGHRLSPSDLPYRANVHALKQLGATHLLSFSAVGSL